MNVYERHKPIRNKISEYKPESIIELAIERLHQYIDRSENPNDWNGYTPWGLMLLIRWSYQYSMTGAHNKVISDIEFNKLFNSVSDLNDRIYLEDQPKEARAVKSFLARTMFVQLPYQIRRYEVVSSIGRQLIIFNDLGKEKDLVNIFKQITGIDIDTFFELYFLCFAACNEGDSDSISHAYFVDLFKPNELTSFFSLVSLTEEKASEFIKKHTNKKQLHTWIDFQINEHTPLERYPFLTTGDFFIPYSLKLIFSAILNNLYDIFKESNRNFSRDALGNVFERYVEKGLMYASCDYLGEVQLTRILPSKSKVPDFLVSEPDATILIDAKSTELNPVAKILQNKSTLVKNLESTLIHGVEQLITAANSLSKMNSKYQNTEFFGVIVTYKDYLLGTVKDLWDDILKDILEKPLESKGLNANIISPTNLFIISAEEFDYLIAGVKEKKIFMSAVLRSIAERDKIPETTGLMAKQHLDKIYGGKYYRPDYVQDSYDSLIAKIGKRLPNAL